MSQRPHEAGDRSKSTQWCSTVEMYLFHTSISMRSGCLNCVAILRSIMVREELLDERRRGQKTHVFCQSLSDRRIRSRAEIQVHSRCQPRQDTDGAARQF